jgi:formamidopyrimidine-DNA glycosylase
MPELPELEALRIRLAPRLENKLITAATINPKKAHMLRYPVEHFANELPARRIVSLVQRGKHLVFGTELGGGGSPRWLVINPMLGGRFQVVDGEAAVPATEVFTIRIEGRQELRYLDFKAHLLGERLRPGSAGLVGARSRGGLGAGNGP